MQYEIVTLEEKKIIGLTARTGNNDPEMTRIIGGLWQRFMGENLGEQISGRPNAFSVGLYSAYDFAEMTYDVTVGVESKEDVVDGFSIKIIPAGRYAMFRVKGDVVKDVSEAWDRIWELDLDRSFTADFEEYVGMNGDVADVNLYIALK